LENRRYVIVRYLIVPDVLFRSKKMEKIPEAGSNLMSVRAIMKEGAVVVMPAILANGE
jgi:hypothetical protein